MVLSIYLDNSDYSRIADCLAGRGEAAVAATLKQLLVLKEEGKIQFIYSMALLSELLQYDSGGRELTLRKAQTIEFLCNGRTFRHHARLLAAQTASVAQESGLLRHKQLRIPPYISTNNGWFPAIGPFLAAARQTAFEEAIADTSREQGLNRESRRRLKPNFRLEFYIKY